MEQRAGWYDDPEDPLYLRYFDGVIWTKNRQPKASPTAGRSSIGYAGPPGTFGGPAAGGQQDTHEVQGPPTSGWGQKTPPHPPQQPQQPQQGWGQPPQQPQQGWGQQQPQQPQPGWSQAPQYGPAYGGYAGAGAKTTPDGQLLAGWGVRLGAYIIDGIIVAILSVIASAYWVAQIVGYYRDLVEQVVAASRTGAADPTPGFEALQQQLTPLILPITLVGLAVTLLYNVGFLVAKGATPGKLMLGLEVRRRDVAGKPGLRAALLRQVIPIGLQVLGLVPFASLLLWVPRYLDYLWPLWDDKNQALHDKVAGTNVVVKHKRR